MLRPLDILKYPFNNIEVNSGGYVNAGIGTPY